jgi:hypothetical protein
MMALIRPAMTINEWALRGALLVCLSIISAVHASEHQQQGTSRVGARITEALAAAPAEGRADPRIVAAAAKRAVFIGLTPATDFRSLSLSAETCAVQAWPEQMTCGLDALRAGRPVATIDVDLGAELAGAAHRLTGVWTGDGVTMWIDPSRAQARTSLEPPFSWKRFLVREAQQDVIFTLGAEVYEAKLLPDKMTITSTAFQGVRELARKPGPQPR